MALNKDNNIRNMLNIVGQKEKPGVKNSARKMKLIWDNSESQEKDMKFS